MNLLSLLLLVFVLFRNAIAREACADRALFPYVRCNELSHAGCLSAAQFGCNLTPSDACTQNQNQTGVTICADNKRLVKDVILSVGQTVDFKVDAYFWGFRHVFSILVDASPSMRDKLSEVVEKLSVVVESLVNEFSSSVTVAAYGGEQSSQSHVLLQPRTTSITALRNALSLLPTLSFPSGPSNLLRALRDFVYAACFPNIIIVIGDKPGREPACRTSNSPYSPILNRSNVLTPPWCPETKGSLFAVNMGEPGLDAELPKLPPCAFDPGRPVAPGQLSTMVNLLDGAYIEGLSSSATVQAVQAFINSHPIHLARPDGLLFRTNNDAYLDRFDTCGERVIIESPVLPLTITPASPTTFDFRIRLSEDACRNGAFECTMTLNLSIERTVSPYSFRVRGCT